MIKTSHKLTSILLVIMLLVSCITVAGIQSATALATNTKATGSAADGSTSAAIGGKYGTNTTGVGKNKTITVDGSPSEWDSSMLIAQGVANDDPRVYCKWSMHEIPIDSYALYAAWDDNNLYLMWEMTNVQDVVAKQDDFPLSQGNLWIYNLPIFLALSTDNSIAGNGTNAAGKTLWDSGLTYDNHVDTLIAFSTNGSNGPFIYKADNSGKFDFTGKKASEISMKWGNGILSKNIFGLSGVSSSERTVGDTFDTAANWVDFNTKGHNSSKLDMTYELSIPLTTLGISKSTIEQSGIGAMLVSTFGTSGMNSLPFDSSMIDNSVKSYSKDPSTSFEKEDVDHLTVPFARIGKMLDGSVVKPTEPTTTPTTTAPVTTPAPVTSPVTTAPVVTTAPITAAPTTVAPTTPATTAPTQTLTLNGKSYKVGDYVQYSYNIKAGEKLENIQASIAYDGTKLKIMNSSTNTNDKKTVMPILSEVGGVIWNTEYPNMIYFNATDVNEGYNFTNGGVLFTVTFQVIGTGTATIDMDIVEMNSPTISYITNGDVVSNFDNTQKVEETQYGGILGDANSDKLVNVNDATLVQKWAASLVSASQINLTMADVNKDNSVNVKDATEIQKKTAGLPVNW